jgi:hypothetical protein
MGTVTTHYCTLQNIFGKSGHYKEFREKNPYSSLSFFNKSVTALFLLVDFQPCVIGIRFKFAQQKQSSYTFIQR